MMSYRKQLVEVKKYNHDRVQIRCANQRKSLTDLNAKYKNLIEENKQLRDLLKECKNYIPYSFPYLQTERYVDTDPDKLNLIARINIAISEMPKEDAENE